MAMSRRKKVENARSRIGELFAEAGVIALRDPAGARALIFKARKLASRKRVSLRAYNRRHCRKCCAYFTSKTLRVRTRGDHIVYACLGCGHVTRLRKR